MPSIQLIRKLLNFLLVITVMFFDLFSVVSSAYKINSTTFNTRYLKPEDNISGQQKKSLNAYSSELSDTNIWSNAMNFKQTWGSAVDPRTGIFTAHIKAGSLLSNLGHGPNIDLEANYSSMTVTDKDNLSTGWQWNLTWFNPATNQLVTAGGQNFYLQQNANGRWRPRYHKLHDIRISGDKKTHFVITYANGLREILSHEGYETTLMQQDGNCVHFSYVPGTHQLQFIIDDHNNGIKISWKKHKIIVSSKDYNGKSVKVLLTKENNHLRHATLPLLNKHNSLDLYIHYTAHFITQLDYPTGLKKIVTYNCTDAIKIPAPAKGALCAVSREITDPGAGQPTMMTRYNYMQISNNGHDYLGFNAGLATDNLQKDILFAAPSGYTYKTSADNGLIKEVRTYNKYHLLIDSKQFSDRTGGILSAIHYFFCRTDQSDGCTHTSFSQLPVTYSLPLKIVSKVWGNHSGTPAVSTVTAKYDDQGRITDHTDNYGRLTHTDYCLASGDSACPALPHNWSFNTLPERIIQYPAADQDSRKKTLPVVITYNFYQKEPNHNGTGYSLKLKQQMIKSEEQYTLTTREYYHDANNALNYGLLSQLIMTGSTSSASELKHIIRHYYYKQSADGYRKITYSTLESEHSKEEHSPQIVTSLFTNQKISVTDSAGNNTLYYHYDPLGRLIQIETVTGNSFSSSAYYNYLITPEHNEVQILPPSGLRHKIIFDNAGRAIKFFDSAITAAGKIKPRLWQLKKINSFDAYGRLIVEHSYHFNTFGKIKILTVTRNYDDLGRILQVHLPDGTTQITQYDDPHLCMLNFQQDRFGNRSVISVVKTTLSGQPVKRIMLPITKKTLPSIQYLCTDGDKIAGAKTVITEYDGFGRVVLTKDHQNRITKQHYDSLGHLISVTGPEGNQMQSIADLAGHIIQQWSLPASGGRYLLFSAGYNASGQRLWQMSEDGKKTLFTYNKTGQLTSVSTPSGHIFSWQYNLSGLPVDKYLDNKLQLKINYDPLTMLPVKKEDITGVSIYTYGDDGLPQTILHNGKNGYPDYHLLREYDNNRRLISKSDISGNKTQFRYDSLGRIITTRYNPNNGPAETLTTSVYDGFSWITDIHYGSKMHRKVTYDNWGHIMDVTDTLEKKSLSKWQFSYDSNDNITTLLHKADHHYALLHYQYNAFNDLKKMVCTGSADLPLCPRETDTSGSLLQKDPVITQQNYTFTPLNKLKTTDEVLYDPVQHQMITKTIHYRYNNLSAPLRPAQINISWNHQLQKIYSLSYDVSGNMRIDAENKITYNALNQITSVTAPNGKQSNYIYDGSGKKIIEQNQAGKSYFFYSDDHLINTKVISANNTSHIIGYHLVAKSVDNIINEYYESNYKGDVTAILKKADTNTWKLSARNLYSPYGMVWHTASKPVPLYQQSLVGFNGERTDPVTGWQFLGSGQRVYNSRHRYFVTEDPLTGGYNFCNNNPIMNSDPSGNMPEWVGTAFKWMGYISTFGLSAIHQRWANIAGSAIIAGTAFASLGLAIADAGSSALFTAFTAGVAIASTVPVAAASLPPNRGLDITASVIGVTTALIVTAASVALLGFSMYSMLSSAATLPDSTQYLGCVSEGLISSKMQLELNSNSKPSASIDSDQATEILINKLFENSRVKKSIKNDKLYVNSLIMVNRIWKIMMNFGKEYPGTIGCDSLTILLAALHSEQPIDLDAYYYFVRERMYTDKLIQLSECHPYEYALREVLAPFGQYIQKNITSQDYINSVFAQKQNSAMIIRGVYHMTLLQVSHSMLKIAPGPNLWWSYKINNQGVVQTFITEFELLDLSQFKNQNGDLKIIGYIRL